MQKFYKIKFLLICIGAITANCEGISEESKTIPEDTILPFSQIADISDGKVERNKRGLLEYLLSELNEYFDYGDEDDTNEDEKYLICRNCTVLISQSGNPAVQPPKPIGSLPSETVNNGPNIGPQSAMDTSNKPVKPAEDVSNSGDSKVNTKNGASPS